MTGVLGVLLADDEEAYVQSLAKILRRRGMNVTTAGDGAGALTALEEAEFDVIVLDLCMPGMNGLATLEEIRRRDSLTPVLLLSAHADVAKAAEALRRGATDYLVKPCPVDTLAAAIEDAGEKKALARRAEGRER
jgi:DNA-binding NtrC family response regulator